MPEVFKTSAGTRYLKEPGVAVIADPHVHTWAMRDFLNDLDPAFHDYEYDPYQSDGDQLCKVASQLCYLSFGTKRTANKDTDRYFWHILESGHGSVLEHANYTLLFYGVSRSFTHELVRHRAGFAFSQVSQRYVGPEHLRFVERPEYQEDGILHSHFLERIDHVAREYGLLINRLVAERARRESLTSESRTEARKSVRQAARSLLPNETEAPIIVTANLRAWRHFIEMRASKAAEAEIRRVAVEVYRQLVRTAPASLQGYGVVTLEDKTQGVESTWRKV